MAGGNVKCWAVVDNSMGVLRKLHTECPCDPGTPPHRGLKTAIYTKSCTWMLVAASFITVKRQKPPQCLSKTEWMNKGWCIPSMDYHSARKRNEVLTRARTWGNPENSVPSKRSQAQKVTYCVIPFRCKCPETGKFVPRDSRFVFGRGWRGRGEWRVTAEE